LHIAKVTTVSRMKVLSTLVLGATLVAAHGYVDTATIGGQVYTFYQPYTDPYTSPTVSQPTPIRKLSW
jgi:hypothetical protein